MKTVAALTTLLLASAGMAIAADTPFAAAKAQGQADATNPAYQEWYLGEMRPAFAPVFQSGLGRCARLAQGRELSSLGLVFVVRADGSVGEFFASDDTRFARCLEDTIRGGSFPPAPKDDFHFGLDLAPPPAAA